MGKRLEKLFNKIDLKMGKIGADYLAKKDTKAAAKRASYIGDESFNAENYYKKKSQEYREDNYNTITTGIPVEHKRPKNK